MAITEQDYPKITELLTLTKTVTLNCDRAPFTEEELESRKSFVYLNYGGSSDFYGCLESGYTYGAYSAKPYAFLESRFRVFEQDNGEIGLEIKFLPGKPALNDERHIRALWNSTRLHEIMFYEEYVKNIKEDADWVDECFGDGGKDYALIVDVTKAHKPSLIKKHFDPLLKKPLRIKYKGNKQDIHIGYWENE